MKKDSQHKSKKVLTVVIAAILLLTCFLSIQTASASPFAGKSIISGREASSGTTPKQFSAIKPSNSDLNNSESFAGNRGSLSLDDKSPSYTIKADENEDIVNICVLNIHCCLHPKVTYHPNGGVGTINEVKVICNGIHVVKDQGYYRTGYDFVGWNTMPDGSGKSYSNGDVICLLPCHSITLYAQWKLKEEPKPPVWVYITYYPNGGTGSITQRNEYYGANHTVLRPDMAGFTRAGYFFSHWNTKADGTGVSYAAESTIYNVTANISLYAQWEVNGRTLPVTYYPNGGSGDIKVYNITPNTVYYTQDQGYTRDNYYQQPAFGWNTKPDGTGISYMIANHPIYLTTSLDLYAQWKAGSKLTVTYYPNGGVGDVKVDYVVPNGYYTIQDQDYRWEGFIFIGWNTRADGLGVPYSNNQGIYLSTNLTLYAQWIRGLVFP